MEATLIDKQCVAIMDGPLLSTEPTQAEIDAKKSLAIMGRILLRREPTEAEIDEWVATEVC